MQHPYDTGYERGKADGIAEERARLEPVIRDTLAWLESFSMPPTSTIQEKQDAIKRLSDALPGGQSK